MEMTDVIFIAVGIVALTISPALFTLLSFPLYKIGGGKGNIIEYTKSLCKAND